MTTPETPTREELGIAPGKEVAWQLFGHQWCLTGQWGHRPIFMAPHTGPNGNIRVLETGLLVALTPDHPFARFIVDACNGYHAALAERDALRAENEALAGALETIADTDADELCHRCEGNGGIYADGKAHYYSEGAPTIPCPACGGSGRIVIIDTQEIARTALSARAKRREGEDKP